jgi:hypothetical protein
MLIATPAYRFLRGILLFFLPIFIVLFSISMSLGNAQLHKNTLKNSNFYPDLSSEIKAENGEYDSKNGVLQILVRASVGELATPGWLQFLTEKNIDLTTKWLNGEKDDWSFYLPTDEINLSLTKNIDAQVKNLNKENGDQIKVCSDDVEESIKKEGYYLGTELCLPKEVKSGNKSLTEFLGVNSSSPNDKKLLNTVVRKNSLTTLSNNFNLSDQSIFDNNWVNTINQLKSVRDFYLKLKVAIYIGLASLFGILLIALLLYKLQNQNVIRELRKILWIASTNTLFTSLGVVLIIGGSSYLTSSLNKLLLPGLGTSKIISLLTWEILRFSFNLVSLAILIAAAMLGLNLILLFLEKILHEQTAKNKNAVLVENSLRRNDATNPTLDGQFHSIIQEKKATTQTKHTPLEYSEFQNPNSTNTFIKNPNQINYSQSPIIADQTSDFSDIDYPNNTTQNNIPDITNHPNTKPINPIDPNPNSAQNSQSKGKNMTWF